MMDDDAGEEEGVGGVGVGGGGGVAENRGEVESGGEQLAAVEWVVGCINRDVAATSEGRRRWRFQ